MYDNNSTIKLASDPALQSHSKHIHMRFHFLRDLVHNDAVRMTFCGTHDQVADVLTKPLKLEIFERLREQFGLCEVPVLIMNVTC